jgi:hypothetical protein
MRARTRSGRLRTAVVAAATTTAVLVSGVIAVATARTGAVAEAAAVPIVAAPDAAAAAAAAAQSGTSVEDESRRTEREQTFANPDGTWTVEQNTEPVRVRRPDGTWTAVDLTLRATAGQIRPVAAPYDVRFSAGGSGPFARVAVAGGRLSLLPPWPLPAPVLSGARARYPDVLPGVDLVLTAKPEGFSEVLVVKDRTAASNPALRSIRFGVRGEGLTVVADGGGLAVLDAAGRPVLISPRPTMWDSTGGAVREVDAPTDTDRAAPMALTVTATDITVTPDMAMLTDPTVAFPLHLDPVIGGPRNEWIMISSGFPAQEYHRWSGTQGMGLCDVQDDSDCVRDQIKRLSWEFGLPAVVRGTHVLHATFTANVAAAYNCTARAVQLWLVGAISSASNWNNHSDDWLQHLNSVSVARGSGCSPGPGPVEFNATAGVATAGTNGWSTVTLGLRAGSESSMAAGWKRFRNNATLSITFNSLPGTPTNASTDGAGCASGSARPVISTATPTLRAVVSDPDRDGDLRASFTWQRLDQTVTPAVWRNLGSGVHSPLATGGTGRFTIPSGLTHTGIYRWRVQAIDPWSYGGTSGTDPSGFTAWCEFEVDTQGPAVAPAVSSPVYGTDPNRVYGGVGRTADFTFTASGVTDVTAYRWGWADPPTTAVTAPTLGASVTLPLTPPPPVTADPTAGGLLALYVVSVDRSGRTSPATVYPFTIGSAPAPVGEWRMAEPAGATTLADASGGGRPAAVTGATAGAAGRLLGGPSAVSFDGVDDGATATGVPVDTTRSFSVAAWLAPNPSGAVVRDAVSLAGDRNSAFFIRQNPDGRWVLYAVQSEVDNPPRKSVVGTTANRAGVWTHVVAVHDAAARQLRLYVNGALEGTITDPTMFRATQAVQFGRNKWQGANQFWWRGGIAETRIWDRVLSPSEVAGLPATVVGLWSLDGSGADASPFNRPVTGPDSIMWTDDHAGLPLSAVSLNGTDEALTTAGPVLRTDQSFTVAAWMRPHALGVDRTAVSQRGAEQSAFFLGLRRITASGGDQYRWTFSMPSRDDDVGETWVNVSDATHPLTVADLSAWTHVAGVFDATGGQVRIYVDGALVATAAWPNGWSSTGPLEIGRGWWSPDGGPARSVDAWAGDVDDVLVFHGAATASQIRKVAGL